MEGLVVGAETEETEAIRVLRRAVARPWWRWEAESARTEM